MFPNTTSEYSRIHLEKHKLNITLLKNIEETIKLFCNIFQLMCKKRNERRHTEIIARRVERQSALQEYERGRTPSFISASKKQYDKEFADKDGIILLEIHLGQDVPYLDLETVLGLEYKYVEEKEILLSPFVDVSVCEIKLTSAEKRIIDKKNKPPLGKYQICARQFPDYVDNNPISLSRKEVYERICQEKDIAINAIEMMNKDEWDSDFSAYIDWKDKLQSYLKRIFSDMWYRGE